MSVCALIGLGSNLGDRKAALDGAVCALKGTSGIRISQVSRYHETKPVGGPSQQGTFLNAATLLETTLDPLTLLRVLQEIELRFGRVRTVPWGERTLDLDLLLYGGEVIRNRELEVPHPWIKIRRFVLAPAVEVASEMCVDGRNLAQWLANLERRPSYLAIAGWGSDRATLSAIFDLLVRSLDAAGVSEVPLENQARADPEQILKRRLAILRGEHRSTLGHRWLVSDFFLPEIEVPGLKRLSWTAPHEEGRRYRVDFSEQVPHPTFIATPKRNLARLRRVCQLPMVPIQSQDPEQIVSEILVACAATRS
jgi:2-amino-4-hydroxy-6-hydroxymethyldihydropteridine diphosphokinase